MGWYQQASGDRRGRYRAATLAAAFLAGALPLNGCTGKGPAPVAGAEPLEISPATNGALQTYLRVIRHNPAAFAVSVDGNNSFMFYCPDRVCTNTFFSGEALERCEGLGGQECVVMYLGREPQVAFSLGADKNVAGLHGKREGVPRDYILPW